MKLLPIINTIDYLLHRITILTQTSFSVPFIVIGDYQGGACTSNTASGETKRARAYFKNKLDNTAY